MSENQLFPLSYAKSREGFLAEAKAAGAELESYIHPVKGPDGETLAMDVARFGLPDADRVLVINSGTHGVEGHCGSGVQRSLINATTFAHLPPNVAVVLVHAVNPYGFAYDRRVDHQNIDVNRNFIDRSQPLPENKAYEELFDTLNPTLLDEEKWAGKITSYALFHGRIAAFQATMGGQFQHPNGIQYGGVEPSWSNTRMHEVWKKHASGAQVAASIDIHTGLGNKGRGVLFQTANVGDANVEIARRWWGRVKRYDRPSPEYTLTNGGMGPAFETGCGAKVAVPVVLEFGTHPPKRVYSALRADNWLEHHADRASALGREISARVRAAFFIDEPEWRWRVLERGHAVVHKAIKGLAELAPSS
jgi:hypothetical protein